MMIEFLDDLDELKRYSERKNTINDNANDLRIHRVNTKTILNKKYKNAAVLYAS